MSAASSATRRRVRRKLSNELWYRAIRSFTDSGVPLLRGSGRLSIGKLLGTSTILPADNGCCPAWKNKHDVCHCSRFAQMYSHATWTDGVTDGDPVCDSRR